MKNKLLLLLLCFEIVFQLTSCRTMQQNNFIIYDKVPLADTSLCAFYFNRPSKVRINPLPNSSYIIDSCHKYQIGDDWWWLQHKNNK